MEIYLVGGAVRDKLLNYPFHERDWVVVGSTPQELTDLGYQQVGKDFPVFLHPKTHEEYALARTERKTGEGYTGFSCFSSPDITLEEDLLRRDLTINAMAESAEGDIIDPYGGQKDLNNRLLRHVSDAFNEDPLRILRVARFAARYHHLGFKVAEETMHLLKQMVLAGEAEHLVPERVWQELTSALSEQSPGIFFHVLHDCGALAIILPELDPLFENTNRHPPLALSALLSQDTAVRFAVLTHNLDDNKSIAAALLQSLTARIKAPNNYTELAKLTAAQYGLCKQAMSLPAEETLNLIEAADALRKPERFDLFLSACQIIDQNEISDIKNSQNLNEYPPAKLLKAALKTAKDCDVQQLVASGFKGKELGEQLRIKRIALIQTLLNNAE